MQTRNSQWDKEEFEELVACGLLAQYEGRPTRLKKMDKCFQIDPNEAQRLLRQVGVYFAPSDRLIDIKGSVDARYEVYPDFASWAENSSIGNNDWGENIYLRIFISRRIPKIPYGWGCDESRKYVYEGVVYNIDAEKGIKCSRVIGAYNSKGESVSVYCERVVYDRKTGAGSKIQCFDTDSRAKLAEMALVAVSFYNDSRYLWKVTACEEHAKASFGIYEDEIKSLFYSREIPLTETGRKRPILHWVAAHRRRMKSGHDIDIKKYMRGITEFEMNGTKYTITAPAFKETDKS